jgi:hypothetical protein
MALFVILQILKNTTQYSLQFYRFILATVIDSLTFRVAKPPDFQTFLLVISGRIFLMAKMCQIHKS